MKFFDINDVRYEFQKTFKTCVNPKTGHYFKFDFYVPKLNLLLEYDGVFHFEKLYKDYDLKKRQLYDRYKNIWSYNNGYELIRIKYTDKLDNILHDILNRYQKSDLL